MTQLTLFDWLPVDDTEGPVPAPAQAEASNQGPENAADPEPGSFAARIASLPPLVREICRQDLGGPRIPCEQCDGDIEHPIYDGKRTVCSKCPHTAWLHDDLLALSAPHGAVYFSSPLKEHMQALIDARGLDVTRPFRCHYCRADMYRVSETGNGWRCRDQYYHYFWHNAGRGFWIDMAGNIIDAGRVFTGPEQRKETSDA